MILEIHQHELRRFDGVEAGLEIGRRKMRHDFTGMLVCAVLASSLRALRGWSKSETRDIHMLATWVLC